MGPASDRRIASGVVARGWLSSLWGWGILCVAGGGNSGGRRRQVEREGVRADGSVRATATRSRTTRDAGSPRCGTSDECFRAGDNLRIP